MQTRIQADLLATPEGQRANRILRNCVHCGFCTATCPTYRLLGDELDSPRGRIYLIKQVLEGGEVSATTQGHLDRCLTCRSCETTCPSGVEYGHLVDIGRGLVERRVGRPAKERLVRWLLRVLLPYPERLRPLLRTGQFLRPLLPKALRSRIPIELSRNSDSAIAPRRHARRMLMLEGCVQSLIASGTNRSAQRIFDRLGIELVVAPEAGCCGAVSHHLNAPADAKAQIRRNIDAWWPEVQTGAEAIVMTASGCGAMVRDWGDLLRDDPDYADKAARISAMTRDAGEILHGELAGTEKDLFATGERPSVAFQNPCSLQHGQGVKGVIEDLLDRAGYPLRPVADAHLCCGSAGTYSLLQRDIADRLRDDKLRALQAGHPDVIATANLGCQHHLAGATAAPVVHWLELIERAMRPETGRE
ncbi:MAG: glycolate oxidase subunit GlcF [Gammaproteobacteria bacterium]|nr:glycolate oxidase subunit GlcF [Gammaproteobacteria bacterium]